MKTPGYYLKLGIRIPVSPLNLIYPHWAGRSKEGIVYLWWSSQKPKLDGNGDNRTIVTYDFYRKLFNIPLKCGDLFRITRKDIIYKCQKK